MVAFSGDGLVGVAWGGTEVLAYVLRVDVMVEGQGIGHDEILVETSLGEFSKNSLRLLVTPAAACTGKPPYHLVPSSTHVPADIGSRPQRISAFEERFGFLPVAAQDRCRRFG